MSPTAVAKASKRFPACSFAVADVTRDAIPGRPPYDLVLLQELIWYVLPHLAEVFSKIHAALAVDGVLFVEQCFPNVQNFGREYLVGPDMLITQYLRPAGFAVELQFRQIFETESVLLLKLRKTS